MKTSYVLLSIILISIITYTKLNKKDRNNLIETLCLWRDRC